MTPAHLGPAGRTETRSLPAPGCPTVFPGPCTQHGVSHGIANTHTVSRRPHRDAVTACAWLPDGRRFVSGGADKAVVMIDAASGMELQRWKRSYRVQVGVG